MIFLVIDGYQVLISPFLGQNCRFYPSCSAYAKEAFSVHGIGKGIILSLQRIGRCHPYHCGGIDPVPKLKATQPNQLQTKYLNKL